MFVGPPNRTSFFGMPTEILDKTLVRVPPTCPPGGSKNKKKNWVWGWFLKVFARFGCSFFCWGYFGWSADKKTPRPNHPPPFPDQNFSFFKTKPVFLTRAKRTQKPPQSRKKFKYLKLGRFRGGKGFPKLTNHLCLEKHLPPPLPKEEVGV